MRYVVILMVAILVVTMYGCRTSQSITAMDASSELRYSDTTQIRTDSTMLTLTETDTTRTATVYEAEYEIEFVDGGGNVSIDSAGNVTAKGATRIRGRGCGSLFKDNGMSRRTEDTTVNNVRQNGVQINQDKKKKQTDEKVSPKRWYEQIFVRIGQGVCIAILLWLIVLYLRRKR